MSLLEIIIIAFGLAADAFAVSISVGTVGIALGPRAIFRLSFHFGLFQFIMPILGWLAGYNIISLVESFDHWIAFGLLTYVGIHMIRNATSESEFNFTRDPTRGIMLIILSIATSLDALAVGFTLAMLSISILYPAIIIGIITGSTSLLGIFLGKGLSIKFGKRVVCIGGILLIIIGFRILVVHIFNI